MSITSWVQDLTERLGEPAIGFLIALENVVPPIPSEIILPFAGFQASRGLMNVVGAWFAATVGALVGAWILYLLGAALGYDRLHELAGKRWFFVLSTSDLERGRRFFGDHGGKIVLAGRCVPLVRSAVSVPAGIDRMDPVKFTLYTVIGSGVWNAIFITLGWNLGARWEEVEGWMEPIGYGVLALLAAAAVFLVARKLRRVAGNDRAEVG